MNKQIEYYDIYCLRYVIKLCTETVRSTKFYACMVNTQLMYNERIVKLGINNSWYNQCQCSLYGLS